ncbi:SDR family NAD(P)-dependent oxidoreductase [Natronosalvus rutilus]|uniref:SDR family oxidoreductase n=1 Tax=Natronosalvus rutilus TaxID=2953753 RepID=A0A9E7SVC7_9EURY|nr:SDR family oxidoreductase [Natronosalvus rutilus]UTF55719.1 SDR family oxidoreductase [Natronosalvus rutilus]
MELEGLAAVVTGGAAGIGRGIALELAREGADVAVADVREEPLMDFKETPTHERIAEMGRESCFIETDVSNEAEAQAMIETAAEELGGLDILVNNAGTNREGTVEHQTYEEWREVFSVNLDGVFLCSKFAIPHIRESEHGRIINISSQVAFVAWPRNAAYDSSKAAVSHLTRQMAVDLSPDEITVNAICPGPIKTKKMKDSLADFEIKNRYDEKTLTSFVGEPKDIGKAAVYLASDAGRYVNGHNLVVDGGWLAGDFFG